MIWILCPPPYAEAHPDSRINKGTKVSLYIDGCFYALRSGSFLQRAGRCGGNHRGRSHKGAGESAAGGGLSSLGWCRVCNPPSRCIGFNRENFIESFLFLHRVVGLRGLIVRKSRLCCLWLSLEGGAIVEKCVKTKIYFNLFPKNRSAGN